VIPGRQGRCEPEDVTAEDLAWQLAGIVRWGGFAVLDVTVARHSCLVADLIPHDHQRIHGLFHDAGEAWVWDIASPLRC